jgi:Tol biopolymer transport system component
MNRTSRRRAFVAGSAAALATALAVRRVGQGVRRNLPDLAEIQSPAVLDEIDALALSHSGEVLAIAGARGKARLLAVVELRTGRLRRQIPLARRSGPFWLDNGGTIAYGSAAGLVATNTETGQSRTLCTIPATSGDSNLRGTVVFAGENGRIYSVVSSGGEPRVIAEPGSWPQFLPDKQRYLFTATGRRLAVHHPGTGETRFLGPAHAGERFVRIRGRGDYLIQAAYGRLLAQPYDIATLRPTGEPYLIYERPAFGTDNNALFSVSSEGDIAVSPRDPHRSRVLAWVDRSGRIEPVLAPGRYANPRISPDGKFAIIEGSDPTARTNLWAVDLTSGRARQITEEPIRASNAVWSPDGSRLAYYSYRGLWKRHIRVRRFASGEEERSLAFESTYVPTDWAKLGLIALHYDAEPRIVRVPLDGTGGPEDLLRGLEGVYSPDGDKLAYTASREGVSQVYIAAAGDLSKRTKVSLGGGAEPRWNPTAPELFYVAHDGALMAVLIDSRAFPAHGAARLVCKLRWPNVGFEYSSGLGYWPALDAARFLFALQKAQPGREVVRIRNWVRSI